jgi:hypothetical protein
MKGIATIAGNKFMEIVTLKSEWTGLSYFEEEFKYV